MVFAREHLSAPFDKLRGAEGTSSQGGGGDKLSGAGWEGSLRGPQPDGIG